MTDSSAIGSNWLFVYLTPSEIIQVGMDDWHVLEDASLTAFHNFLGVTFTFLNQIDVIFRLASFDSYSQGSKGFYMIASDRENLIFLPFDDNNHVHTLNR